MIKHLIKYIILKWRWRGKLKFSWTSRISINSVFEGMNQIHSNAEFHGDIGYGSYISSNSLISGKIGRFCSIGPYVRCNSGIHPYTYPFATTAPCFFSTEMYKHQNGWTFARHQCFNEFSNYDYERKFAIRIGHDCWIGEGAFFVGGVNVENGCSSSCSCSRHKRCAAICNSRRRTGENYRVSLF